MKDFSGNKTLLPLIPASSPYRGRHPILINIFENLPAGPKALVVNHGKEEIVEATRSFFDLTYCEQPLLNGTGGALLASREFIQRDDYDQLLITMGDVPFVSLSTFQGLLDGLRECHMVILGFQPEDKRKYGLLEISEGRVTRIIEWKYWSEYPKERQGLLTVCNSGIYAVQRDVIIEYLDILGKMPHTVLKEREGSMVEIEEFFITDLIELMNGDGLKIGYSIAENEKEIMGVDDLESLLKAQKIFNSS
jgi:bifunctional UDP-N-acetylglucosamine pyrophosphorylase/glucosamine-1-phosphate N-acetyltransferase